MTEGESGSGTGVSAVVNAVLIVITIAGFLTLVRQELTSDRPPPPANSPRSAIGIQTLDARLWEDPLRPSPSDTRLGLAELRSDVERRSLHDPVRLLPVMVSGGPYSEDQENRIRSRFAIVSALGQRGYAPLDAEHVGSVVVPWPKTADLEKWAANATTVDLDRGPGSVAQTACATDHGGGASSRCADLTIRFEWYRPRVFDPARRKDYVLVLWLDERFFEDDPLLRLPLLLGRFVAATRPDEFAKDERYVRLIGPQASQTLRAMLPKYDGDSDAFRRSPAIAASIAQILGRIEVFSPSASAMDEVLIGNIDASQPPRTAVREGLRRTGFKDSRFFNATDAQLADEIFAELQLRGVSLAKPHTTDHVVLLSEWDTFYGRMLSLTYGAVLAVRSGRAGNRAEFVKQYLSDGKLPENLHPYAYLRGLDGRTVCQAGSADCAQPKPTDQKQNRPDSFQQIVQWKPEANKAEGPGQFDYLSRTGALLEDLQRELQLSHRGEIKAIGIVGSDVYDVLLILQALRPRFPNALFFTTELDARLWNPKDREWARNLIVAGSYGLTLHRDLQQRIAPFRDSSQTALFAATLAALDTKGIDIFNDMSPRRFEIGNTTAVDLSVTPSGTPPLQPLTNSEESSAHREDDGHGSERLALLVLGLVGLLALYFIWNPLRRRTSRDCGFLSGDLAFFQSDVGGPDGAEKIVHTLLVRDDPVCRCLCTHLNRRLAESADEVETTDEMRLRSLRCNTLLELLNDIVHHVVRVETALDHAKPDRRLIERAASWLWRRRAAWWTGPLRLAQRFQARAFLDGVLDDITRDESNTGDVTLAVAHDARYAARKLFWWRLALLVWLGVVAVVALILGRALRTTMWDDTFLRPDGEPFSLAAGTSAWPNIGLRVVSAVLALLLSGTLVAQLRMLFFRITREYRMPVTKITKGHAPMCVEASELWQKYHDSGKLWQRLLRAVIPTVIFFYFGHELMQLTGRPLQPLRGAALAWWSAKIRYFFVPFLFLTFLTVDAALQWRRFIHELAALPTHYPSTTLTYFQAQRGQVGEQYLEEWIDIQMIADLTEGIGGVLWYPCIVFVVMLASLNSWTDHWPTPTGLMLLLVVNFALSIASVVIVQRAAQRARGKAQESLTTKLKRAQSVVAASRESNDAAQAEKLLEEIRTLRRGAFVGFWQNPALGALLLPSGGTAIVQLLVWLWR